MFGHKLDRKSMNGHGNGKTLAISLSVLAAAVPALWLGGCLATGRPAWFLSRRTVRRMKGKVEDVRDMLEDMKVKVEDMKDRMADLRSNARRTRPGRWVSSLWS